MSTKIFLIVMLASLALGQTVVRLSRTATIDFYHFWGVTHALRLTDHKLGSPYTESRSYGDVLNAYADKSSNAQLKAANRVRRIPDLTGSPLLYASFFFIAEDYSSSVTVFFLLQVLSFLASLVLLGFLYRYDKFPMFGIALVLFISFGPFQSDLRVGNISSFQLFALTLLLALAHWLQRDLSFGPKVVLGALLLTGLSFLTLLKPTVVVTGILIAVHLWVKHGRRIFAASAIPAAVLSVLFLIIPCLYFRSWSIWSDWYDAIHGPIKTRLLYPVELGNFSSPLLLSGLFRADVFTVAMTMIVLLAASLVLTVGWGAKSHTLRQPSMTSLFDSLGQVFTDPNRVAAIGITLTIAAAPLYWNHYYVLSVIPCLWLMSLSPGLNHLGGLGLIALVMTSGVFDFFLRQWKWTEVEAGMVAFSWIPLWSAILLQLVPASGSPMREPARLRSRSRRKS